MDKAVVVLLEEALDRLESSLTWLEEDTPSFRVINRAIGQLVVVRDMEKKRNEV